MNWISFLTSASLSSPWLLALFPISAGALFLVYRKQETASSITVPSIFLLREFAAPAFAKRNPFFPLRLLFELLLVLLLILGAAALSFQGEHKTVLFLIDNSFSMGAFLQDGQSRLAQAKADAMLLLSDLSEENVRVFVSNPSLIELTGEDDGYSEARDAITSISLSYSEDALDQGLSQLLSFYQADEVFIFTERAYPSPEDELPAKVSLQRVGSERSDANVAFVNASISNPERELTVDVLNAGDNTAEVSLSLSGVLDEGQAVDAPLRSMNLTIGPKATRSASLGVLPKEFKLFRAALSVDDARRFNLHPLDDDLWFALTGDTPPIVVVSSRSIDELTLGDLNAFSFISITPENFTEQAFPEALGYIFHRVAPPRLFEKNSLLILPPSSPLISSTDFKKSAVISSWMDTHPLTRFVRFQDFRLNYFSTFELPAWGRELLTTSDGPTGIVGYNDAARVVALGFDLFPFEGRADPAMSIFTLNTLSWLFGDAQVNGFVPLEDGNFRGRSWRTLNYIRSTQNAEDEEQLRPGITSRTVQGSRQYEALNFLSAEESRIMTPPALRIPSIDENSTQKVEKRSARSTARYLALFLIILLGGDLLLQAGRALLRSRKEVP